MQWVFLAMTSFQYMGVLLLLLYVLKEDVLGMRTALSKGLRIARFGPGAD